MSTLQRHREEIHVIDYPPAGVDGARRARRRGPATCAAAQPARGRIRIVRICHGGERNADGPVGLEPDVRRPVRPRRSTSRAAAIGRPRSSPRARSRAGRRAAARAPRRAGGGPTGRRRGRRSGGRPGRSRRQGPQPRLRRIGRAGGGRERELIRLGRREDAGLLPRPGVRQEREREPPRPDHLGARGPAPRGRPGPRGTGCRCG